MTQGRGSFSIGNAPYDTVPQQLQKDYREAKAERGEIKERE